VPSQRKSVCLRRSSEKLVELKLILTVLPWRLLESKITSLIKTLQVPSQCYGKKNCWIKIKNLPFQSKQKEKACPFQSHIMKKPADLITSKMKDWNYKKNRSEDSQAWMKKLNSRPYMQLKKKSSRYKTARAHPPPQKGAQVNFMIKRKTNCGNQHLILKTS